MTKTCFGNIIIFVTSFNKFVINEKEKVMIGDYMTNRILKTAGLFCFCTLMAAAAPERAMADQEAPRPLLHAVDGPEDDTLLNRALLYLNKQGEYKENDLYTPALCHRLDTGTSGLVIIAKTPEAEELFLSAIKNREVQKTYLCVTFGRPMPPDATLGGYLLKDADRGIVKIVEDKQPGAKEVETRYETIAVSGRLALLKVQLITGRTHQIRAHMASIGCPILGDSKYGNNSANRELKLKYQALCAWELTMPRFTQPDFAFLSGKTFHAPKPWYYQQVLDGTLK